MNFIAYNTSLNIKTLVLEESETHRARREATNVLRENNIKKLLPFILSYLHYMVDLNNNLIIRHHLHGKCRPCSIRNKELSFSEVVKKCTKDCFFTSDGMLWECNLFSILDKQPVKIWLNERPNCFIATPNNQYSMTGYQTPHALNVEHYITEAVKDLIKRREHEN